jgi:hypothetical protein
MYFRKKLLPISSLCDVWRHRGLALAAATAAATALAFSKTAVILSISFVHGFHLLSYRRLSIDLGKKIGEQRASALQSYWLMTLINFSVVAVSGANLIINCPQQTTIFSWFSV